MNTMQNCLKNGAGELGIAVSPEQLENFTIFARELCKWNSKINLTSITLPEEIAVKHFIDSLTVIKYTDIAGDLLDIGSGGGFPAIPLKIMSPDTRIVSVDAVEKKINFQRHIARTLGFAGFTALHCRVEKFPPEYKGLFNCIVSRAFADITEFVRHSLPLLAESGFIVAMKGRDGRKEAEAAADELKELGAGISSIEEFQLPLLKDLRSLIVLRKI